jgi:small subunit ribosomal protein S17
MAASAVRQMSQKTSILATTQHSFFQSNSSSSTTNQSSPSPALFAVQPIIRSFSTNAPNPIENMSNEELADTSTIPGWEFVHNPPRQVPRGALVGTVVSDKMTKTVNVAVDRYQMIPKYRKRRLYTRKFMAHDELEVANIGDLVMIVPCHRVSKHKHFMLREIIREKGQL